MSNRAAPVMLVTGGTGSIGGEIASQALAEGWSVVVQGRGESSVASSVARLATQYPGAPVQGIAVDIRNVGAVETLVERAAGCFGRIDAVADCLVTGPEQGGVVGAFADTDPAAYADLAELSIVYLERLAFAALPWLRRSGGCLVSLVSDAGLFPAPRQTLIGAARAAAVGFVRNLALEVARDGVRVHCVSPSFVEGTHTVDKLAAAGSDRLAKARQRAGLGLPTPADIAPLVLFLCGDGAKRITGQVISVNGGLNA